MPGKHKKQQKTTASRRKTKRKKNKPSKASQKSAQSKTVVAAVLDSQKLQDLYATMLRTHTLNRRAGKILSATLATMGREAVLVGAIAHTLPGDSVAAVQDEFLISLIRGDSLKSVIEQIAHGNSQPSGPPEQDGAGGPREVITIKRGMALAAENKGRPNVVLVFPGEYGKGQSAAHEALNLAAKDKLPLVCLAEMPSSNAEEQRASALSAGVPNFPRIAVDGADVVAIFRVAQEAIRRARAGHGPSLIECVMPNNATAHPAEETPVALLFMQQYLERRGLWSEEWQQKIAREFQLQLDAAIAETSNEQSNFNQIDESDRTAARSPQRLEFS
jgi:TPP-dependent pyruvate/acetoin dehydrogenase alpha subunit